MQLYPLSLMKFFTLSLLFVAVSVVSLYGNTCDTISYFDQNTASAFYRDAGITSQAARFDLGAPAYVRKLTIWLAGRSTGRASVRIYGNEGSFSAPLLNLPLSQTIQVRKTKPGVQKIEVILPSEVFVDRPQFFVVVEELGEGIRLLSDRQERVAVCSDKGDHWTYQAIKGSDNIWRVGKYSYAIEAIVDYPEEYAPSYLQDVTAEVFETISPRRGDRKNQKNSDSFEGGIAWGDINQDGHLDLLLNSPGVHTSGSLWLNNCESGSTKQFKEITDRLGTEEAFKAGHFIDIDNDRDLDIVLLGFSDGSSRLLKNDGDGYFNSEDLNIPDLHNPISLSIADANSDGHLDLYIVQGFDTAGNALPDYYLQNTRKKGLTPIPLDPNTETTNQIPVPLDQRGTDIAVRQYQGVQWIDYNVDTYPDLYLTGRTAATSQLWLNSGSGEFTLHHLNEQGATGTTPVPLEKGGETTSLDGVRGFSDWTDTDNDDHPNLLQPVNVTKENVSSIGASKEFLNQSKVGLLSLSNDHTSFAGSGTWADANNDGNVDALITSSCDCRFATLYTQNNAGEFEEKSFEYGLFRVPAGNDAVWVDYNNDGKLDLGTFVGGEFRLYKNTGHFGNNSIGVDLEGSTNPSEVVGARVIVYAGDKKQSRPVVSGRGALMQSGLRVHVGLGSMAKVDSVVVELANGGGRRVIENPEVNRLHRLFDRSDNRGQGTTDVQLSVTPNPFRTVLRFDYEVAEKSAVKITVHSLDGTNLGTMVEEIQEAGSHRAEWRPIDQSGEVLPTGTYIWQATIGTQILTGRAILVR